jgi:hypothetical protein
VAVVLKSSGSEYWLGTPTLGVPYIAEKAYGGKLPWDPMANAWEILNRGDMPMTLVRSARSPVNMKLDRRTSFCTSRAMLSTDPGLESPSAALRSENDPYASFIAVAMELLVRNENADEKSAILFDYEVEGETRS